MEKPRANSGCEVENRYRVDAKELDLQLDPKSLGFDTTASLDSPTEIVGQDRAIRALDLGLAIRHNRYHVFVSGLIDKEIERVIQRRTSERAKTESVPPDWIYVHNFDEPESPIAIELEGGQGVRLRTAIQELLKRLARDIPAALGAKDFDVERERLKRSYGKQSEALFTELVEHAEQLEMTIKRLPGGGITFLPLKAGNPLSPEEWQELGQEELAEIERRGGELEEHGNEILLKQRELADQLQNEIEEIITDLARRLLDPLLEALAQTYPKEPIRNWLNHVREFLLEHLDLFQDEEALHLVTSPEQYSDQADPWLACRINVIVDHSRSSGAPMIEETAPTYKNLFGTVEHDISTLGHVSTNFMRIKPGSLIRSSGGYLVFDLLDALSEPLVWKELKRVLKSEQLSTDTYAPLAMMPTSAIKPQPIPVDTKVIVRGSTQLYFLMQYLDEDFPSLFRIRADFDVETPRDERSELDYGRFLSKLAKEESLPQFEASAVIEILRFGARLVAARTKLSLDFDEVADLAREASYWASLESTKTVTAKHVLQALEERVYRSNRIAVKIQEMIREGIIRIPAEGRTVGQAVGLAVLDLGDYRFGSPQRVTASVGVGRQGVVNIERETELSGNIHDKGVLILVGYLRNRYATKHPLTLSASLTFEQSYGRIEGDSASSVELYCLLSAIAEIPLRQDIAVTGSVDQHGAVQAVGGLNEKVEGFFDVCQIRGLTGSQGVCIPRSNLNHLVLRPDVLAAIEERTFHIWAIETVDEGLELLSGVSAGTPDEEGSFHHSVELRFQEILKVLSTSTSENLTQPPRFSTPTQTKPSPPSLPSEGD